MADQTSNNYHWAETNVSNWITEKITEELVKREYKILSKDITAKICQRMNALGMVFMISFEVSKDGKIMGLKNFVSMSEIPEGIEHFDWFMDFFKELEAKTILKYGNRVIECGTTKPKGDFDIKKIEGSTAIKYDKADICGFFACLPDEILNFLTNYDFIMQWTCGRAVYKDDKIILGNVTMSIPKVAQGKILISWKFDSWKSFSSVVISMEPVISETKVMVNQTNIPIKEVENVRQWWYNVVFMPISGSFGLAFRPLN